MAKTSKVALDYFVNLMREGKIEYRDGELWRNWELKKEWLDVPRRCEKKVPNGYYVLRTFDRSLGKPYCVMAHRVIWTFLIGEIPEGHVINHKNGIKDDNRIENLETATYKENATHAIKTGLLPAPTGMRNPNCKVSDREVDEIRDLISSKLFVHREIAVFYGVGTSYISAVNRGHRRSRKTEESK